MTIILIAPFCYGDCSRTLVLSISQKESFFDCSCLDFWFILYIQNIDSAKFIKSKGRNKNGKENHYQTLIYGLLEVVNRIIDSASIANTNTKTGGSYYHWKHGDIYYRTFGEKDYPPMLLIHDLTVWSSEYEWLKMGKVLSDTYRIYCVDLIGCGKSDKPGITYTNYFYVQMITDFVKEVIKARRWSLRLDFPVPLF